MRTMNSKKAIGGAQRSRRPFEKFRHVARRRSEAEPKSDKTALAMERSGMAVPHGEAVQGRSAAEPAQRSGARNGATG